MKQKTLNILKGPATIVLYFCLALFANIIFKDYNNSPNKTIATISQIGTYIIICGGICLPYYKRFINDFKKFKKDYINTALRNWLIGLCLMIMCNIILTWFIKDIPANESLNRSALGAYPISSFIYMAILGPIAEEVTFRASFKDAFKKWYTFSLVTAFFFAFAHIAEYNLLEFLFLIPYGVLGFFFAKAFYETDNIYTSIIAHILHNSMCITLLFLL